MSKRVAASAQRYRDLDELVHYRSYEGSWSGFFEENILRPKLRALGYTHVRFFGGKVCDYDGGYRERVCELKRDGEPVEYRVYG
ncbi:MAG: hypothetical protein K2X35_10205 [Bryobacteraceae bacterium]|nr:hypothetical protein [Bryobacteraceae bacterium]